MSGKQAIQKLKPSISLVLNECLKREPPWTSFFIKYEDVDNWAKEHYGWSHFNWTLKTGANYHILRTGCYPYMKYHCTKRPIQDLTFDDKFFRFIKVANLGLPCLFYGIAAKFLIKHVEYVTVPGYENPVPLYFLYEEDKGAEY